MTVSAVDPCVYGPDVRFRDLTPMGSRRSARSGFEFPLILPAPGQSTAVNANTAMQVVALQQHRRRWTQAKSRFWPSTDRTLNQAAVDQASSFARGRVPVQPGATMQSSEIFFTFEFLTPGQYKIFSPSSGSRAYFSACFNCSLFHRRLPTFRLVAALMVLRRYSNRWNLQCLSRAA